MTAIARRSAPLGRTEQFNRATVDHRSGAGVLVVGDRGVGRTTFASTVAEDAARNGRSTLWITASATLQQVPLGAFASMLTPVTAAAAPVERIASVLAALRFHEGAAPTTLIIDDIQLLDESSADVVLQAVGTRAVALIATAVIGAHLPAAVRQLVDDEFIELIELPPLDRDAVELIAGDLLGGPPAPSTAEMLWRWSEGLPGVLDKIISIASSESVFQLRNGYWWWEGPPPLVSGVPTHVRRKMDLLSDTALEALDLIILSGEVDVAVVERLVSADSVVELEGAELIVNAQGHDKVTLRSARTRVARERRNTMPAMRRRLLARRLLDVLPAPQTPLEITRSVSLHGFAGLVPDSAELEQATSILRLSDPRRAQVLAEEHHRASPTVTSAIDLIDSRVEVGDVVGANRLLIKASSMTATSREVRRLSEAAFAVALFADRDPAGARRLVQQRRQAAGVDGPDATLSKSLDALALLLSAQPNAAGRLARQAIAEDSLEPDQLRAGVTVAASLLLRGETEAAHTAAIKLLDPAERLAGAMPSALGMLRAELAFIQLWRGELTTMPDAHPLTGRWPVPPSVSATTHRKTDWALMSGIVSHLRGEHVDAVRSLNEAVVQQSQGKGIFHAEASAWLTVALCDAGRTTDAARALQHFPERHLAMLPGLHLWARGVVAATCDRLSEAAELLTAAAAEARSVGAFLIESRYLVEVAERCGDDGPIARIDELAHLVDAPLLQALCHGAVAKLKGDSVSLLNIALSMTAFGLHGRAKAMARFAEAAATGSGEPAVARQARRVRRLISARPAETSPNFSGLSPRELEVARLAGGGMTDREIAARLVLSVRTIESHLASTYRKLAVSSRTELAPMLR
jgi:DNA-binding CsgD family transcriptional regulator